MKALVEVTLEGNIKLPASLKVDTLGDVAKLGAKLTAMARNAMRLFPEFKTTPVKALKIVEK